MLVRSVRVENSDSVKDNELDRVGWLDLVDRIAHHLSGPHDQVMRIQPNALQRMKKKVMIA